MHAHYAADAKACGEVGIQEPLRLKKIGVEKEKVDFGGDRCDAFGDW